MADVWALLRYAQLANARTQEIRVGCGVDTVLNENKVAGFRVLRFAQPRNDDLVESISWDGERGP
jgi:hypothetical protein